MKTPCARVKIFGPEYPGGPKDPVVADFITTGMEGYREGRCHMFAFAVDYSELPHADNMPRSKYAYPLITHKWNGSTRQGEYFSVPYGGRLEIEAV